MKTKLPLGINTAEQAMKFISDLFNNDEHFHPSDDANEIYYNDKGQDKKMFTIKEAKRVNELIGHCYALKDFDPEKYLAELIEGNKPERNNPFQHEFVEMYYPNYFGSNEIAILNNYWKELEELEDTNLHGANPSIEERHAELTRLTNELELLVYEAAIRNFMLDNKSRVAIYWGIEDIKGQAKNAGIDLTDEQAYEILQSLPMVHDATVGINWDVIDTLIQEVNLN